MATALGYYGISKYLGISESNEPSLDTLNEENYKKIFTWMFFPGKSVVKESRQISDLAKITEYPLALERLEKGSSIEEALLYTSEPSDAFIDMLKKAKQQLKQAKEGIEQLSEEPPEAKELIEDIERLLKTISGGLEANFGKDNSNSDLLQQLASDPETLAQLKKLLGK